MENIKFTDLINELSMPFRIIIELDEDIDDIETKLVKYIEKRLKINVSYNSNSYGTNLMFGEYETEEDAEKVINKLTRNDLFYGLEIYVSN